MNATDEATLFMGEDEMSRCKDESPWLRRRDPPPPNRWWFVTGPSRRRTGKDDDLSPKELRRVRGLSRSPTFARVLVAAAAAASFFVLTTTTTTRTRTRSPSIRPSASRDDPPPPQGSAFPTVLYRNHHGPASSPPCRPRRVRVAQRSNAATAPAAPGGAVQEDGDSAGADADNAVVSMTLTFELDRVHCPPEAIDRIVVEWWRERRLENPRGPDRRRPDQGRLVIAPGAAPGTTAEEASEASRRGTTSEMPVRIKPIHFDYQTEAMRMHGNDVFHSDDIYHVPVEGLLAGPIRYNYRIQVVVATKPPKDDPQNETPSSLPQARVLPQKRSQMLLRNLPTQHLLHPGAAADVDNSDDPHIVAGTLVTPPAPRTPTRLALVGDLGQTWFSTLTMLHIWREAGGGGGAGPPSTRNNNTTTTNNNTIPITNLVIAGDMSYADSDPSRWKSWFELMEPLLRFLPTHVAAGNHELECDRDGNLFTFYEHCFRSPNRVQQPYMQPYSKRPWEVWKQCSHPSQFQAVYDYGNAYYSYEHGLAKVIVLSSYSHTDVNSTQYLWLEKELATEFRRDRTPWLVVVFHSPFYTTFLGHQDEIQSVSMRAAMEFVFVRQGVNLVVSGHDHAYLRTHPMYLGQVVPSGRAPVHWTLGAGGNREGHSAGYVHETPEPWVAKRSLADFGYGSLYMPNATHAQLAWMRDGVGIGLKVDEMAVDDDVWIVNPYTTPSSISAVA